ncbi:DUF7210 family protein [Ottowia beijingensis]|uniref:DUF7210 family protein n=1 Tax=Ottowia beijingensis TaxID=1207057 RepID=UPI004032D43B
MELVKPHRHAGRDYQPGARLTLPAHKADWLIGVGSARDASPVPAPTPAKPGAKD